jgi:hypothetical protein
MKQCDCDDKILVQRHQGGMPSALEYLLRYLIYLEW